MTDRDITTELAEMRKREQAATAAPWTAVIKPSAAADLVTSPRGDVADCGPEDAVFVAHARTDVPRLLAAVEAALKLADTLTDDVVLTSELRTRLRETIAAALTGEGA